MNLREWISYGITKGFCSEAVCDLHNGPPISEDESLRHLEGEDFCVMVLRIYELESDKP
jgi:hypothetical protein